MIHIPKKTIKEIRSGKYNNQYLIYCRKSTDDSENQKNSLGHQKHETDRYVDENPISLARITIAGFCSDGVISESHSGFKEDDELVFTEDGSIQYKINRPKFNQLVRFLSEGHFAGIICMSWDRLSRNKADNAIITKLIRNGVYIQFVTTKYDDTSAGALHMDIDGMFAQHHSRVTREKVTNAMHKMRYDGIVVHKAPLGYLNTGMKYQDVQSTEHKPFDPVRAPLVKELFEKYATGDWSMPDLAKWTKEQGLRGTPMRRRRTKSEMLSESPVNITPTEHILSTNSIYQMLDNRFYTGMAMTPDGNWIPSKSHKALVSVKLFEQVQEIRYKKKVSVRYKKKLGHALRGVMRCEECTRVYTPYMKKGTQYFGSRCAPGCTNSKKSCNLEYIESRVQEYVDTLSLTKEELNELDQSSDIGIALLEAQLEKERTEAQRRNRKINEDLSYLRENRLTLLKSGMYSPHTYIEEEKKLLDELMTVQEKVLVTEEALHETVADVIKLSELLKKLSLYYKAGDSSEKEKIIRILFSELTMSDKTFICSLKREYRALKKDSVVFCPPTRNRT